jgi:arylsulfatase A-like enzyme
MKNQFLALLALLGSALTAMAADRPNVIFILADDYGWRDLTCYGSTFYETPNLDRLAAEGMRFTQAYAACSVCSPTRASILTGKYPARLHITDWLPGRGDSPRQKLNHPIIVQDLPHEEITLAQALKEGGYQTGLVGKWHLGGPGFYPQDHGFDFNFGGSEKGATPSFFSPYNVAKAPGFKTSEMPNLANGPEGEYLTDRLTDEALKFIERSKDKPFFLYLAHYAVHTPHEAKAEMIEKYRAKAAKLPPGGVEFRPEGDRQARQVQNQPVYASMIQSLDESVGRVMAKLTELGLEKKTVIVFTSDNGGLSTSEGSPTSNLPLRGGKGWNYEGGIREPLLVKWPGVTKPGSVCDAPVISTDYYPTILEMAGLPPRPAQHVDGVSFRALLQGGERPERPLYWHYPHYSNQGGHPGGVVRVGDYKLLESYEDMRVELFNLKDDIGEKRDLADKMPEKVAELREKLHAWRESVAAQMPTVNPDYAPAAKPAKKEAQAAPFASTVELALAKENND